MNKAGNYKYVIKLLSPWHQQDLIYADVCFSPSVALGDADGALWEHFPDELMLTYRGPKAWYSNEPQWHSKYRDPVVRAVKATLEISEWLHYAHVDPKYRVPHITHWCRALYVENGDRHNQAVAVVSNAGGKVWYLRSGLRLRNRFVTHPAVCLYGRRSGWESFRRWGPIGGGAIPSNYCGELDCKWTSEDHIQFLAKYRAAVCLENSIEPLYFTEKFVNAVRAGCVPVYHAHSSVKPAVLRGALWIDPADHGYDPERTVKAALDASPLEFQSVNSAWLKTSQVQATHFDDVWSRLAEIFIEKLRKRCTSEQRRC